MKPNILSISNSLKGQLLFGLSFTLIIVELFSQIAFDQKAAYTLLHGLAVLSYLFSAYYSFFGKWSMRSPNLVFVAYVLLFFLLLFVWLMRFSEQ